MLVRQFEGTFRNLSFTIVVFIFCGSFVAAWCRDIQLMSLSPIAVEVVVVGDRCDVRYAGHSDRLMRWFVENTEKFKP